jgi:DNA-binding SARP family transcriptional activator
MDFRILGPLEVLQGDKAANVGRSRQLTVLALLLLEEGSVVSSERLMDAVWDGVLPRTARNQIQICVTSLRKMMSADGDTSRLVTQHPGYLLKLDNDYFDLREFESGVAAARQLLDAGGYAESARQFRTALSLWRGPALSGVNSKALQSHIIYLEEMRLASTEACLQAEFRIKSPGELVPELTRLVNDYPLQEHLQAMLITALYEAGRQAEALDAYRAAHQVMVEGFGIEPSQNLQLLHMAILNGEQLPGPRLPRG